MSTPAYFQRLGWAMGARYYCVACHRPSILWSRLLCEDCHVAAETREPGPWRKARQQERLKIPGLTT